jgi:hypothetical protein
LSQVGTGGCGFEQQLESAYKAIAPDTVSFPGGRHGNASAGGPNAGFVRSDAILAIVHLSDEDDCSVSDTGGEMFDTNTTDPHLRAPGTTKPLGLNIRCTYADEPETHLSLAEELGYIWGTDRYVEQLKANVKPLHTERIVFAAIVGVPQDIEDEGAGQILADPRMLFAIDSDQGHGDPSNVNAIGKDACTATDPQTHQTITAATPGIRFAKVAEGFGENGLVRSICAPSYEPTIDLIIDKIAAHLNTTTCTDN